MSGDACPLCGGSGEVSIVPYGEPDNQSDWYGCPICLQREYDGERERLRAATGKDLAVYQAIADNYHQDIHRDATRYRWLRAQHWDSGPLAVVRHPRQAIKLGHEAPNLEVLDKYIDEAMLEESQRGQIL